MRQVVGEGHQGSSGIGILHTVKPLEDTNHEPIHTVLTRFIKSADEPPLYDHQQQEDTPWQACGMTPMRN